MSQDVHNQRKLDVLTVVAFAVLVVVVIASLVSEKREPAVSTVALYALLVIFSENVGLRFPLPVAITPQAILVMAAIVSFDHRGVVVGSVVVGACGGLLFDALRARRVRIVAFNMSQLALAAGAAGYVFEVLHPRVAPWVLFPAVVISYIVVNVGLVISFVSLKSAVPMTSVWREVRSSQLTDAVFSLIGLLIGELYLMAGPITVVVSVAVAIVAHTAFQQVVKLRQAYTRLDVLYRFTQRLEGSRDERETVMSVLTELRSLFRAGTAELTFAGDQHWQRTTVTEQARRPIFTEGAGAPPEAGVVAERSLRIQDLPEDDPVRLALAFRVGSDAMIVPMRSEGVLVGTIVLAEPLDGRTFDQEDLRLLEALGNHAAVSLENSRLLGRLRYDSHHDQLTGLPNRARFNELIADLPQPSAVLLTDLDRFKEINDTLGHHHGDLLLTSVARRISDEVGHRGIVARLGGDEFGVLLPQTGSGDAAQVAVSLLGAVEQPFQIGELELEITASIGVAISSDEDNDDGSMLLQRADVAMYSAKESHSGWELYSAERDHYSPRRLTLAGELRRAIDGGELEIHYQPKSELATGEVRGVEALVRWRHPRYGIIGPDHFIPVAESAGLIRPLTAIVLTRAIKNQRELRTLGFDIDVAVNLSVRSVLDVNLPNQVAQVLTDHGVPPSSLILEITEGSVMADPTRTIGILGRLSRLGVGISVDDFGTGYSSLSYLKRLPANEVKIDRTFVAGMLTNDSDRAIVRSTVDLARNLGLRAVAEGVEDKATWDALRLLGCDYAQGYYISPPLPSTELRTWLLSYHPATDPTS